MCFYNVVRFFFSIRCETTTSIKDHNQFLQDSWIFSMCNIENSQPIHIELKSLPFIAPPPDRSTLQTSMQVKREYLYDC